MLNNGRAWPHLATSGCAGDARAAMDTALRAEDALLLCDLGPMLQPKLAAERSAPHAASLTFLPGLLTDEEKLVYNPFKSLTVIVADDDSPCLASWHCKSGRACDDSHALQHVIITLQSDIKNVQLTALSVLRQAYRC